MEQNSVENQGKNTDSKQIAGAIIIAGLIIAGAILLKGNQTVVSNNGNIPNNNGNPPQQQAGPLKPITSKDHIWGNSNAKIIVVEYSDFDCPFCKSFHVTMKQIVEKNNGKVAWIYRHFPLPQLHPNAFKKAESSECVAELAGNDAFWKYADKLFEGNPPTGLDKLPSLAGEIGLDVSRFTTCLSSGKYKSFVDTSIKEGSTAGVTGTPKSFIVKNGKVVDTINGAEPIDMVTQKIDAALK